MKNTKLLFFAFLAAAALLFAAGCSGDSDDDTITASDLVGTTWTHSYTITGTSGGTPFTGTGAYTLEFHSGGKVTCSYVEYKDDGTLLDSDSNTYTYSVSGSTVTLDDDGDVFMELTYSSGKLVRDGDGITFTKS